MLNEKFFKDEKYKQMVVESEKKRYKDVIFVDRIYQLRKDIVETRFNFDETRKSINKIQKEFSELIKTEKKNKTVDLSELKDARLREKADQEDHSQTLENRIKKMEYEYYDLISRVGNLLDESVPVAETDEGNVVVREVGDVTKYTDNLKSYDNVMSFYTNLTAGSRVSGNKAYFLTGKMAIVARALKNYGLDFLIDRGYEPIQTPVMVTKEIMKKTCQISEFEEQLYETTEGKYLIATSEQPLTAFFDKHALSEDSLPKVFAGESLCFRREAGKVNHGLFRVHQFDKVEQFIFCKPEDSYDWLEKLVKTSEEFLTTLGLSYRVVKIASGEMNDAAAKKYDIEAYFPADKTFKELVSASNCTDYQSRSLNVRYGFTNDDKEPKYVHMLNATLVAVQRTLCCLSETCQVGNKFIVPEVLRKYTRFDEFEFEK